MQKLQYIVIGDPASPSFSFEGDEILGTSGDFSVDMIGAELCTDVMEVELSYDDTDGTLRALPWATPVYFYRGGNLEGKLYSVSVTRIGKKTYRLRTTSAAGIMEHETFYGGMYTGQTFERVVETIVGSNGLQPYSGVYRHFYRIKKTTNAISGLSMGSDSSDADACFLTATMSSKLSAKVRILGFIPTANVDYFTEWTCAILGACSFFSSQYELSHRYGLYMVVRRASTSVPFPLFGEVYFVYGATSISLGIPTSADEATYELDVNPDAGTAVINGIVYSITLDEAVSSDLCPLHVYGGGCTLGTVPELTYIGNHSCQLEMYYYTIKDSNNNFQADYVGVRNDILGTIDIYDNISHIRQQNVPQSMVMINDLEHYDVSTYGKSPYFINGSVNFQKDVLARLAYADEVRTIPIYGWLPICTKLEALQQLLFATGVILIKDDSGSISFTVPSTQSVDNIDTDSIYDAGSEEQPDHINTVDLTEHAYTLDTAPAAETIYENIAGSSDNIYYIAAYAKAPAMQDGSSGITCMLSNCNAAVVIGSGTLTGHPYVHAEKVLQRTIASFPDGRGASVLSSTLITVLNSEAVLDRLQAYYSGAKKTRVDIAMLAERCGLMYSLASAWGESFAGYLVRINKVITSIVRATCEFISGYTPPQLGNNYTNYDILTGSGTWTVPASVFEKETPRIHVVLIGGGRGGDGGFAGQDGMQPEKGEGSEPAAGGAAGESGIGGKVFEITIVNPAASYDYICGQGGPGGSTSPSHTVNNPGMNGNDTTVSGGGQNYSSANGESTENGYYNIFTGERYAWRMIRSRDPAAPLNGDGGNGGYDSSESWGSSPHDGVGCNDLIFGEFLRSWSGGSNGTEFRSNGWVYARGGGGGGAGYGENGENGGNAYFANNAYHSGDGGNGGNATRTPPKATDYYPRFYGYGGLGGGGGGGGGAGGWVLNRQGKTYVVGTGGAGGYGGQGGDGGDGCVLIYY